MAYIINTHILKRSQEKLLHCGKKILERLHQAQDIFDISKKAGKTTKIGMLLRQTL